MDKIALPLTAAERKLLSDEVILCLDTDELTTSADGAVLIPADRLEELHGDVAFAANHAKSEKRQAALDGILRKIEARLEPDEPPPLRLHDPNRDAASPADHMAAQMEATLAELGLLAGAGGSSLEELIQRMMPTRISPDEKLPVTLVAEERQMVLGLDGLDEPTRQEIQSVEGKKRTIKLTLGQIDALARLVSRQVDATGDKAAKKRWDHIRFKLEEPLGRFYTEDSPRTPWNEWRQAKRCHPDSPCENCGASCWSEGRASRRWRGSWPQRSGIASPGARGQVTRAVKQRRNRRPRSEFRG